MYRDDAGMFVITAAQVGLGVLGMVTNVATCYIAAKATGQEFGIGDLVIAAAAGFVGGCIKNNFYATVARACLKIKNCTKHVFLSPFHDRIKKKGAFICQDVMN